MTKKTTTTVTIATLYFVGVFLLLVSAYITVRSQKTETMQLRTTLAEQNAQEQVANTVAVTLEATASDREKLRGYFLSEKETISFIADVEALADTSGVTVETTMLDIVRPQEAAPRLKAGFAVAGTRDGVERFIEAMEQVPYHSSITSVRIARESGQVWTGSVDILITLEP